MDISHQNHVFLLKAHCLLITQNEFSPISKVTKQFDNCSKATEFKVCSKTQLAYYLGASVKAKTNYILRRHFGSGLMPTAFFIEFSTISQNHH